MVGLLRAFSMAATPAQAAFGRIDGLRVEFQTGGDVEAKNFRRAGRPTTSPCHRKAGIESRTVPFGDAA
jgi:hypothetical protein